MLSAVAFGRGLVERAEDERARAARDRLDGGDELLLGHHERVAAPAAVSPHALARVVLGVVHLAQVDLDGARLRRRVVKLRHTPLRVVPPSLLRLPHPLPRDLDAAEALVGVCGRGAAAGLAASCAVGVVLPRELLVRPAQLVGRRVLTHAQDGVGVVHRCAFPPRRPVSVR
eukprot:3872968-Prymnesium_polylepis.1